MGGGGPPPVTITAAARFPVAITAGARALVLSFIDGWRPNRFRLLVCTYGASHAHVGRPCVRVAEVAEPGSCPALFHVYPWRTYCRRTRPGRATSRTVDGRRRTVDGRRWTTIHEHGVSLQAVRWTTRHGQRRQLAGRVMDTRARGRVRLASRAGT